MLDNTISKKVLITGQNGYIANSFREFCRGESELIDLKNKRWHEMPFGGYDALLHTAGLVHVKSKPREYYRINRDLTYILAQKAKADGVRHFIFLSSAAVYGTRTLVDADTVPVPDTHYGMSKLQAEELILPLAGENFKVAVLRPPMVYGESCPGNYAKLAKLIKHTGIFPDYENRRENVSISTLCSFIATVLAEELEGTFFPKESAPISTTALAQRIAAGQGRNLRLTKAFNGMITVLMPYVPILNKMFGDFVYESG